MSDIEQDNYVYPGTRFTRCGAVSGQGQGMSLRDAAALAALQGFCADPSVADTPEALSEAAWRIADAFIAARKTGED